MLFLSQLMSGECLSKYYNVFPKFVNEVPKQMVPKYFVLVQMEYITNFKLGEIMFYCRNDDTSIWNVLYWWIIFFRWIKKIKKRKGFSFQVFNLSVLLQKRWFIDMKHSSYWWIMFFALNRKNLKTRMIFLSWFSTYPFDCRKDDSSLSNFHHNAYGF